MASGYDVTIKLYQHHVIERVTGAVVYFVLVTLSFPLLVSFPLLAEHSSAALPCKRFVNKQHANDLSVHYSYITPHPNR